MAHGESIPSGFGHGGARNPRQPVGGSFHELFEHAAPTLYTWARLRIRPGLRRFMEVEDLLQEVWTRGSQSFDAFDPARGRFQGWLLGIARNALLESLRRLSRTSRLESRSGAGTRAFRIAEPADSVTTLTRRVARNEAIERLLERVETLPPDERHLFLWCGLEERTCAEAARRLGLSESAATKRWKRLRDRLRDELADS